MLFTDPPCIFRFLGVDLPRPTKDMARLRHDLLRWGFCLVEHALSAAQLAVMRARVVEQAAGERTAPGARK